MAASHSPAPDSVSPALEAVILRFGSMIRSVGWRHRLSDPDIDELMQQVRIRLWQARGESEQISRAPASYVYQTAVSAALDMMRRRRSHRVDQTVSLEDSNVMVEAHRGPERELETAEFATQLARTIELIPASRRPVVRMYLAGHSREEIAELLGWSEAKTRNLLYRGLNDLRMRLSAQGIGWETAT